MVLDKYEQDLLREARKTSVPSLEVSKPITVGRFVNICRGLAQKAFAYPSPEKDPNTFKIANDDNDLIDRNIGLIQTYESYIQSNDVSGVGNMFGVDSLVDGFAESIANMKMEINEVKTTTLTSKQITDPNRFRIKYTPGSLLKL